MLAAYNCVSIIVNNTNKEKEHREKRTKKLLSDGYLSASITVAHCPF